jgi:hypothetical protein
LRDDADLLVDGGADAAAPGASLGHAQAGVAGTKKGSFGTGLSGIRRQPDSAFSDFLASGFRRRES